VDKVQQIKIEKAEIEDLKKVIKNAQSTIRRKKMKIEALEMEINGQLSMF
jgi:hypothetical protein